MNPNPSVPHPTPSTSIAYLSSNPNFINPNSNLSSLNKLVQLSHDTLGSLAGLVTPLKSQTPNENLIQCPFDPRHIMPPHSLFLHYLRCPSSPRPLRNLNDLLQSLTYPKTLKSSDGSHHNNLFLHTLDDPAAELCFSLDDYVHSGFNFFYRDCPGVVTSSYADATNNRTFTLPGFLSVECSNFIGASDTDTDTTNPQRVLLRIFPSEYWTIRNEVQAWNDYPVTYSYGVIRAISGVRIAKGCNLLTWIIANSPRFGVIIDIAMQQHIFLLFSLCLKSILREASSLMDVLTKEQTMDSNLAAMSTRCPIMLQALTWLGSQLSILYGATNGKLFVLHLLKLCILDGASCLLLFPFEQKFTEATGLREEFQNSDTSDNDVKFDLPVEQNADARQDNNEDGTVCSRKIFVSQVAAAIAALHERSILEDRIKGLWFSQHPTRYQLLAEHCYVSEKANEERKKRPDYRPVIDHDGLARQQSCKQDSSKEKTREELLAEERDYKRRRMSYRGKKIKRSALQVTRDIIEDYMEEIKQAGGIGAQVKESQERETFPSNAYSGHGKITIEAKNLRKVDHDSPEASACIPSYYEQQSHTNYCDKRKAVKDDFSRDYAQSRHEKYKKHGFAEDQWSTDDEYDREYASRSTERNRSHSRSHDHSRHRMKQDYSIKNYDQKSRSSDRRRSYMHKNQGSASPLKNAFEDRYDPSESTDICDDDISSSTKYSKPVKFYDEKFH
ncbi:hypothetical protein L6164_035233 [Bauhinia variegata]|uniref:Uncharacterized protein n=1 Tax=Bauhinia variegata TaxID=167791 RepID=A0ACB9KY11_BAUVA|nr:hypothetical protein L6164_035233 [Bauhinia variegata]